MRPRWLPTTLGTIQNVQADLSLALRQWIKVGGQLLVKR